MLEGLGLEPLVRPVDIDESPLPNEVPEIYVERLAREKAEAQATAGELILAADTIVALEGALLGKPRDESDARRMLELLQGREHSVSTGVALHEPTSAKTLSPKTLAKVVTARVRFTSMSAKEISWYIASGEPMDKAGAYGIQGLGALFVDSIQGDYHTIVGLPLSATYRLFDEMGYRLLEFRAAV